LKRGLKNKFIFLLPFLSDDVSPTKQCSFQKECFCVVHALENKTQKMENWKISKMLKFWKKDFPEKIHHLYFPFFEGVYDFVGGMLPI